MSESLITKKALASGLKELTRRKSFDKITIHDITEECGLNRQTFYYHFQDKYELLNWVYYSEAISIIIDDLNWDNWDQKVLLMLTRMKNEEYFYCNTLRLSAENEFREYLFRITAELFRHMMEGLAVDMSFSEHEKKFIAEFYAFGIVGVIISWAQHDMKEAPETISRQLKNVSIGTQKFALSRTESSTEKK